MSDYTNLTNYFSDVPLQERTGVESYIAFKLPKVEPTSDLADHFNINSTKEYLGVYLASPRDKEGLKLVTATLIAFYGLGIEEAVLTTPEKVEVPRITMGLEDTLSAVQFRHFTEEELELSPYDHFLKFNRNSFPEYLASVYNFMKQTYGCTCTAKEEDFSTLTQEDKLYQAQIIFNMKECMKDFEYLFTYICKHLVFVESVEL